MADIHGSPGDAPQMPQAGGSGPAPVPYAGADQSPEPPSYAVGGVSFAAPGAEVMNGIPATFGVQESGYAHDISAGVVAPYYAGAISPILVHGDADAGGRDIVDGTVAGAVTARESFYLEYEGDATQQGPGTIGDLMQLPPMSEDASAPANDFLWAGGDQPGKGT